MTEVRRIDSKGLVAVDRAFDSLIDRLTKSSLNHGEEFVAAFEEMVHDRRVPLRARALRGKSR